MGYQLHHTFVTLSLNFSIYPNYSWLSISGVNSRFPKWSHPPIVWDKPRSEKPPGKWQQVVPVVPVQAMFPRSVAQQAPITLRRRQQGWSFGFGVHEGVGSLLGAALIHSNLPRKRREKKAVNWRTRKMLKKWGAQMSLNPKNCQKHEPICTEENWSRHGTTKTMDFLSRKKGLKE